jgi:coenzyme F420-0:L-glutamate ligase/coenzyme F420-1:gamma-L-glutamate ligase
MSRAPAEDEAGSPVTKPLRLGITALAGVKLVHPGDDLAAVVIDALAASGERLADGDVLVLAQKIVSKAEGRYVVLDTVTPSPRAVALAAETDKDPRLVELILSEATEVVRHRKGVLVVAHRIGVVLANAGIDASNVEPLPPAAPGQPPRPRVLLLPKDPDASCRALAASLRQRTGARIGVVINDSLGRAWRNGTVGAALGAAGLPALLNLNGRPDLFGRTLQATQIGLADEIAAAASLVMGQADEGRPIVLLRGLPYALGDGAASELVRPKDQDLFR